MNDVQALQRIYRKTREDVDKFRELELGTHYMDGDRRAYWASKVTEATRRAQSLREELEEELQH